MPDMSVNLRGILLMIGAMAGFAVEDCLIKIASADMPPGQVILILGALSAPAFGLWARATGATLWVRNPVLWARTLAEVVGTLGFISALATIPLSTATAILQAAPILVMAGAALVLREPVGWRRWTAAGIGFVGILLILRPGAGAFQPQVLWAVLGVGGMAARDLITRSLPRTIATPVVATWANAGLALLGSAMLAITGDATIPGPAAVLPLVGVVLIGLVCYWAMIEATRAGEISVIAPFRYSRLIFGATLGVLVFDEPLTGAMIAGSALIVGSGIFILTRERRATLSRRPV